LRPACGELATASAANDFPDIQEIDEAVIQLVKDYQKKLTNNIDLKYKLIVQVPGVSPVKVIILNILFPGNAPLWEPVGSCNNCTM